MKIDSFEYWIEEIRPDRFNISEAAWRLLKLAGQYESVIVRTKDNTALEVIINNRDSRIYPLGYARGTFRMVLARIGHFYMQSGAAMGNITLYGFEGEMEIEDNFGCIRILEIKMDNRLEFYLKVNIK